jgi:hypothetical protein
VGIRTGGGVFGMLFLGIEEPASQSSLPCTSEGVEALRESLRCKEEKRLRCTLFGIARLFIMDMDERSYKRACMDARASGLRSI